MTLIAAWVRTTSSNEELVLASDSRLSFGARWDCCPKILPLPRGDAVLCFAGDTAFAYPVLLQLFNAIGSYDKALSRVLDIGQLRPHFINIIDRMRSEVYDLPKGQSGIDPTDFKILLAGYSWKSHTFRVWSLQYNPDTHRFSFRSLSNHLKRTGGTKRFVFVGDEPKIASTMLYKLLSERSCLKSGGLNMEPFEILVSMIRDPQYDSIGGPPQVVKVYPHMNSLPHNVLWPVGGEKTRTYLGRPLLSYESNRFLTLDPDSLQLSTPWGEVIQRSKLPKTPKLAQAY